MTEIKICGITNRDDACFAAAYKADALGFIFHPQSPRYVAPEIAKKIIKELPDGITTIGVFVNRNALDIKKILEFCSLDMAQLHGAESPAFCRRFPRAQVIKAIAPRTADDLKGLRAYPVAALLVDAFDPVRRGGTGKRADWGLAAKIKEKHPLILAGGLSLANIQEAIEQVAPHCVDINSGVEHSPGKKNHAKVKEIIELVHQLGGENTRIFGK